MKNCKYHLFTYSKKKKENLEIAKANEDFHGNKSNKKKYISPLF